MWRPGPPVHRSGVADRAQRILEERAKERRAAARQAAQSEGRGTMSEAPKTLDEWLDFSPLAAWDDAEKFAAIEVQQALSRLDPDKARFLLALFGRQFGVKAPTERIYRMCGIGVNKPLRWVEEDD